MARGLDTGGFQVRRLPDFQPMDPRLFVEQPIQLGDIAREGIEGFNRGRQQAAEDEIREARLAQLEQQMAHQEQMSPLEQQHAQGRLGQLEQQSRLAELQLQEAEGQQQQKAAYRKNISELLEAAEAGPSTVSGERLPFEGFADPKLQSIYEATKMAQAAEGIGAKDVPSQGTFQSVMQAAARQDGGDFRRVNIEGDPDAWVLVGPDNQTIPQSHIRRAGIDNVDDYVIRNAMVDNEPMIVAINKNRPDEMITVAPAAFATRQTPEGVRDTTLAREEALREARRPREIEQDASSLRRKIISEDVTGPERRRLIQEYNQLRESVSEDEIYLPGLPEFDPIDLMAPTDRREYQRLQTDLEEEQSRRRPRESRINEIRERMNELEGKVRVESNITTSPRVEPEEGVEMSDESDQFFRRWDQFIGRD